jgi:ribosomal protein S18 acetylase RimI-like enzyme
VTNKEFFEIRPLESDDYELLERFFKKNNLPEVTRQFHPFPLSSEVARRITLENHLDRYYIVVVASGEIGGLCMLRGWDEGYKIPSFGVIVDIQHRRLGLGRMMTEFAINEAKRLRAHRLRLSVNTSNTYAKGLYESLGFKEISKENVLIDGKTDTKIVMIKDLLF